VCQPTLSKRYFFPKALALSLLLSLFPIEALANPLKIVINEATKQYSQKNYDKALMLFDRSIEIYPKFPPAYYFKGLIYKETNVDPDIIIETFLKALEVNPHYSPAVEELSKIYYGIGDFENAEIYGKRAVKLSPDNVSALLSLSWTYLLGKSEPEKSIIYFKRVLEHSSIPYAHFGLGMAYFMDHQRILVMDEITSLRKMGVEGLAKELEKMVRKNEYKPPTNIGLPLVAPMKREKSTLIRDIIADVPKLSSDPNAKTTPVRLGSQSFGSSPSEAYRNGPTNATDRIKKLRRNSTELKGSGY